MPLLCLMRHGRTEGPGEDPPLSVEGARLLRRQGRAMRRIGLPIDAILTSPLARARGTAACLAEEMGLPDRVSVVEALRPGCRMSSLANLGREERGILCVGHAPDMGIVTGALAGLEGAIPFERGTLAGVAMDAWPVGPPARLVFLLPPAILVACAGP